MTADYMRVACPFNACAAQAGESCQEWAVFEQKMRKTGWPHPSRLRLADSRRIEELENCLRDAVGWNPSPFPPEVKAEWNRLLAATPFVPSPNCPSPGTCRVAGRELHT